MTTRLNNSMIYGSLETPSDVHSGRFYFQLTCVNSALELSGRCALQIYLLTYLIRSLLTNSSTVAEGPRNAIRGSERLYVSPGDAWRCSYWWNWCVLMGGRSLCAEISHGKGQPLPTIFGVVSQQAELSRWASRRTHGRARPYHSALCQWRQSIVFRAVSHQGGNWYCFD